MAKYSTSRKYVGINRGGTKSGRKQGASMGGTMETTKGYQKRRRAALKAEEAYWASMNGPVTVRKIGDTNDA